MKNMEYSGAMIALMVPKAIARQIAVDGGTPQRELHITLAYFEEVDIEKLQNFLSEFATNYAQIEVKFNGYGKFEGVGDNGEDAHYLAVDSPELMQMQKELVEALDKAGIECDKKYKEYIPHITLRYGKPVDEIIPDSGVMFDAITLGKGREYENFPFVGEKSGRRVRTDYVRTLNQAIDLLQEMLLWASYGDGLKVDKTEPRTRRTTSSGANYAARAGEVIIGNLARGEGGRFVSAENLAKIEGVLLDNNVSAEMLQGMQDVFSGAEISDEMRGQLEAAGLINEFGVTGNGLDILNAVKTGDPDKVKDVMEGGSGGGGGGSSKKPKSDKVRLNMNNVSQRLENDEILSKTAFEALLSFSEGYDVDVDSPEYKELVALGLISESGAMTKLSKDLLKLAKKGDKRGALDLFVEEVEPEAEEPEDEKRFYFKSFGDTDWFVTWTTNAFKDREAEIFETAALEKLVDEKEDLEDKADVLYRHCDELKFATVKWQGVVGKFLVELSKFDDTEIGRGFKAFFEKFPDGHPEIAPNGWACSHGYVYKMSDKVNGVYKWFDKKETTVLPLQDAANLYTLTEFFGEKKMNDKTMRDLEVIAGEIERETGIRGFVSKLLGVGKARTAALVNAGVEHKEAQVKTEDGVEYPMGDYAYVGDVDEVGTWKLRLSPPGKPGERSREQLGAASAALSEGGFRGNRVELPEAAIDSVKKVIRDEYEKLDVGLEDMPESVKEANDMDKGKKSMYEKVLGVAGKMQDEMKAKVEAMAEDLKVDESDIALIARQLMEVAAEITDETLRAEIEALALMMQEMIQPEVEEEETMEDEEMVEDEAEVVVPEVDTKAIAEEVAKMLDLDKMAVYFTEQANGRKEFEEGVKEQFETLAEAFKTLVASVQASNEKSDALAEEVKSLKQTDEEKIEEKVYRNVPRGPWSTYVASKDDSNVLNESESKQYSKPKIPSVINAIGKKIGG